MESAPTWVKIACSVLACVAVSGLVSVIQWVANGENKDRFPMLHFLVFWTLVLSAVAFCGYGVMAAWTDGRGANWTDETYDGNPYERR